MILHVVKERGIRHLASTAAPLPVHSQEGRRGLQQIKAMRAWPMRCASSICLSLFMHVIAELGNGTFTPPLYNTQDYNASALLSARVVPGRELTVQLEAELVFRTGLVPLPRIQDIVFCLTTDAPNYGDFMLCPQPVPPGLDYILDGNTTRLRLSLTGEHAFAGDYSVSMNWDLRGTFVRLGQSNAVNFKVRCALMYRYF